MSWIDSHCHLDFLSDPANAMARAEDHGIRHWVLPGTDPNQWVRARERFERDRRVHLAFGHHPWYLPEHEPDMRGLRRQLEDASSVVALGETGLDFHNGPPKRPPADHQEAWFEAQLRVAQDRGLPVIVHSVKAHDRVLHYLKQFPDVTGVIHAFSGSYEQAMAYVDKGWYLGCGSLILKSGKTRDAFARIPLDHLMLETDAPDMRPRHPIHSNPLLDVLQTVDTLIEARGVDVDTLESRTNANTQALFKVS